METKVNDTPILFCKQKQSVKGVVGAIESVVEEIGNDDFILVLADEFVYENNYAEAIEKFKTSTNECMVGLYDEKYLEYVKKNYTFIKSPDGFLYNFIEKPQIVYNNCSEPVISLITVGAVGTAIDGMNDFHLFSRKDSVKQIHIDNYLEWGMLGWVFVCDLMGKEKHNWVDQLCLVALAEGMNGLMVHGLKNWVNEPRPDGAPYSFPSGHTSNAFLGAHMAYKEFKDSSPILAYSGYAIAAFVAGSRLYNNRHWVADVVAGAGFGILSVELSYLIYFPIRNAIARRINRNVKNCPIVAAPVFSSNMAGFYLTYQF